MAQEFEVLGERHPEKLRRPCQGVSCVVGADKPTVMLPSALLGRPKEARFALRSLIASPRDNLMGNLRRFVDRSARVMTDEERSYMTNEW